MRLWIVKVELFTTHKPQRYCWKPWSCKTGVMCGGSKHPEDKRLTWKRSGSGSSSMIWSRIDFFLVSNELVNNVLSTDIIPCIDSDHSAVFVTVETSEQKRGPGVWKFNNMLLNDNTFCEQMREILTETKVICAYLDPFEKWECIKWEAVKFTHNYAKNSIKKERCRKQVLLDWINEMQQELIGNPTDVNLARNMEHVENKVDAFNITEAQRSAF